MPTLDYLTGFNPQIDGAGLSDNSSGLTFSTAITRHAGGASANLFLSTQYWSKIATASSTPSAVFYFYFATLPNHDCTCLGCAANVLNVSADYVGVAYIQATSQFALVTRVASGTPTVSTAAGPTLTTGVFYRVEISVDKSANPWTLTAQVATGDGLATSLGSTTAAVAATTATAWSAGFFPGGYATAATTGAGNVTDIAFSNVVADYPIGPISVYGYSPNAVGTHNLDAATSAYFFKEVSAVDTALTTSETTSYQTIDDVPFNADADGIWVGTTSGAPATPSFRAAGTTTFSANNVTNTSLTPGAPAGKAVGDFLLLVATTTANGGAAATPSGWNLASGFPKASGTAVGGKIWAFTRIADGSATDTPAVAFTSLTTGTSGTPASVTILAVQNVTETIDGTVQVSDLAAQTTTTTIPAFTTATNNSYVVGCAIKMLESGAQTSTVATFTERVDQTTTSGIGYIVEVSEKIQTTAGSSGTAAVTWSVTTSARALAVSMGFKASLSVVQPTATWYAEYNFADESTLTSAPLAVLAIAAQNLDTATASTWVAKLFDSAQGTNTEDISNSSISSNTKTYVGKTFPGRPSTTVYDNTGTSNVSTTLVVSGESSGSVQQRAGQTFSGLSGVLTTFSAYVKKSSTPADNIVCTIYADSAGVPSATALATASVAGASLTSSYVLTAFSFSQQPFLSDATTYWAVFTRSGARDAINGYALDRNNTDYTSGVAYTYGSLDTWVSLGYDIRFQATLKDAWSIAALNATRIRFGLTAAATGHPRLEAAMLEAAFGPAAAIALPFQGSEGEEHSDPRSLQIVDRVSVSRGSFF